MVKLKQVDHVNHERSVLADVAGHPFITTLITTFSDHDSLYMLVSSSSFLPSLADMRSSIIVRVARYSPTFAKRKDSMRTLHDSTPLK